METRFKSILRARKLALLGLSFSFLSQSWGNSTVQVDENNSPVWIKAGSDKGDASSFIKQDTIIENAPQNLLRNAGDKFIINPKSSDDDNGYVGKVMLCQSKINDIVLNVNDGPVFEIKAQDESTQNEGTFLLNFASGNIGFPNAEVKAENLNDDGSIPKGKIQEVMTAYDFLQENYDISNANSAESTIKIDPTNMGDNSSVVIYTSGMIAAIEGQADNSKILTIGQIDIDTDKLISLTIANDTFDYSQAKYNADGMLNDPRPSPTANMLRLKGINASTGDNNLINLILKFDRGQEKSVLNEDKYDIDYAGDTIIAKQLRLGGSSFSDPLTLNFSGTPDIQIGKEGIQVYTDSVVSFANNSTITFSGDTAVKFDTNASNLTFKNTAHSPLVFKSKEANTPAFDVQDGKTLTFDGNVTFKAIDDGTSNYFPCIELNKGTLVLGDTQNTEFKLTNLMKDSSGSYNPITVFNQSSISVPIQKTATFSVENASKSGALCITNNSTLSFSGKLNIVSEENNANGSDHLLNFQQNSTLELVGLPGDGGGTSHNTILTIGKADIKSTIGYFDDQATIRFTPILNNDSNTLDIPQLHIANNISFKEGDDNNVNGRIKVVFNTDIAGDKDAVKNALINLQPITLIKATDDQLKPIFNSLGFTGSDDEEIQVESGNFIVYFKKGSLTISKIVAKGTPDQPGGDDSNNGGDSNNPDRSTNKKIKNIYPDTNLDGMSDSFVEVLDDALNDEDNPLHKYIVPDNGKLNSDFEKISRAFGRTTTEEKNRATLQLISAARRSIYNHTDINSTNRFNLWASLFGSLGRQSKNSGYKMDSDVYGFLVGVDTCINENISLGLVGGYGKTDAKYKGDFLTDYTFKNEPKSYFGGLYGLWTNLNNDMKLKFLAILGRTKHKESSSVIDLDTRTVVANTIKTNKHYANWVSGNLDFTYKPWKFCGIHVGPWASLSLTHNKQKENDFVVAQSSTAELSKIIDSAKVNAFEITLGIAADYNFSVGSLDLKAGYKHDCHHNFSGGKVTLKSGDNFKKQFDPYYDVVGKNTFALEASYAAQFGNFGVSLGAQGEVGNRWRDFGGSVTASYSF